MHAVCCSKWQPNIYYPSSSNERIKIGVKEKKKKLQKWSQKARPELDVSPKIWILIYLNQGVHEPWSVNYRIQWMCRLCHQILLVKKWKLKSLKPLSRYVCNIIPLWACGIYYIYAVQKIAGAVVIV